MLRPACFAVVFGVLCFPKSVAVIIMDPYFPGTSQEINQCKRLLRNDRDALVNVLILITYFPRTFQLFTAV